MRRKQFTPEKFIGLLRQAEVELAQGQAGRRSCRSLASRSRVTTAGAVSTVA